MDDLLCECDPMSWRLCDYCEHRRIAEIQSSQHAIREDRA